MNKKKIFLIFIILFAFILGNFLGGISNRLKHKVPLAGCEKAILPDEKFEIIKLDFPEKEMFLNYYSYFGDLDFIELYIPENATAKEYLGTFGYNGFHYFKTFDGNIYVCGFNK